MGMRLGLSVLLEPSPHVSWVGSGHETTLQHYLNVYVPYMEVHVHTVEAKWLCNVTYPLSNYVPMSGSNILFTATEWPICTTGSL